MSKCACGRTKAMNKVLCRWCIAESVMPKSAEKCEGCKHAINPQGYFHACNSPERLAALKRFYYVERIPVEGCHVAKKVKAAA